MQNKSTMSSHKTDKRRGSTTKRGHNATALVWPNHCRWNRVEKMRRALDHAPHWPLCRFSNSSRNAAHNRLHFYCQRLQYTMHSSGGSVWQSSAQRRNGQPSWLSSARCSTICMKPGSLLLGGAPDDNPLVLTEDGHHWNMIEHQWCNDQWTPSICTPPQPWHPLPDTYVA